jgi:micrococcal nuclease
MRTLYTVLFSLFFLQLCAQKNTYTGEEIVLSGPYKISKHVDGDTFWVDDGSEKGMKIRFIGVDSPEPRKVFNTPAEAYGKAASAYLKSLIPDSIVMLEFDVDSLDRYKRTLAYIYLPDGTFINAKMVEDGYAQMATYPPNIKYVGLFRKLEKAARENERGLWAEENVE